MELLDSQRFARGVSPDKKQLQVVMIRRLKSELLPKWDGTPRFPVRKLEAIPNELRNDAYGSVSDLRAMFRFTVRNSETKSKSKRRSNFLNNVAYLVICSRYSSS